LFASVQLLSTCVSAAAVRVNPTRRPVSFHAKELVRGLGTRFKENPLPKVGEEMRLLVRYIENPMGEMELSSNVGRGLYTAVAFRA
jgi:hypothetical protein